MSLFAKAQIQSTKQKLRQSTLDQEGSVIEYDVREDEDQGQKLSEIVDLLLAAGYFRARIKGLTSFDKIVGGMVWCITLSNFDVDVDLLFQENSTIGQKISLTEKIVAVLPKMKCPHRLEPHQIQGLDYIHIFPVIQWLVRKAIETREVMGDTVRAYSVYQFSKHHILPTEREQSAFRTLAVDNVSNLQGVCRPQRKFRKPTHLSSGADHESQVIMTLLEYGQNYSLNVKLSSNANENAGKIDKKRAALSSALKSSSTQDEDTNDKQQARINQLMQDMSELKRDELFLSKSALGTIVGKQVDSIAQFTQAYDKKRAGLAQEEMPVQGIQTHNRIMASLQKQLAAQEKKLLEAQEEYERTKADYMNFRNQLQELLDISNEIKTEIDKMNEFESQADQTLLNRLKQLVGQTDQLKKQEKAFKQNCNEEMIRLQNEIDQLKAGGATLGTEEDKKEFDELKGQLQVDEEKYQKIRVHLAKKTREITSLQRKMDDIPSRAELAQYQRRFVELYTQVSSKLTETRQYFTLYNTLNDTKGFLQKELDLLNMLYEKFNTGMGSQSNKEIYLKHLEQFQDEAKNNLTKLEEKNTSTKSEKVKLNDTYIALIAKQREYSKMVRDFGEEAKKNEELTKKSKGSNK